jgi:4-hydroxymandelate oxidase
MTKYVNLDDYRDAAKAKLPHAVWEYIDGGAADGITLRANRESFNDIVLRPRMLNDVSTLDTRVKLLGADLPHPIMLAPVASNGIVHGDGEVAAARGAMAQGAGMVLSSYTSKRVEDVIRTGVKPLWFQLYYQERKATRALVEQVVDAGVSAICVSVDTPTPGARDRQERSGFVHPADLPYMTVRPGDNPCTWDDIAALRAAVKVPIILKGILHPEDAELAIKAGASAIIVSNHGGRNLDTAIPTIDALSYIGSQVNKRIPVLLDGGVRRGTDVLKAIAFGADAVLIGRPYVHGLAVNGSDGVAAVIAILRRELEMAMALMGRASLAALDRAAILG